MRGFATGVRDSAQHAKEVARGRGIEVSCARSERYTSERCVAEGSGVVQNRKKAHKNDSAVDMINRAAVDKGRGKALSAVAAVAAKMFAVQAILNRDII